MFLEGVCDRLRDGCGEFNAPADLVVGDLQLESLEDLSLDLGRSLGQRLAQVGKLLQLLRQLVVLGLLALGPDLGQRLLEGFLVSAKLGNALRNQLRLDPVLQCLHLCLDPALDLGDPLAQLRAGELAVLALAAGLGAQLLLEALKAQRPEDPLLEEAQDQPQQPVLAGRDELLIAVGLQGCGVAVAGGVLADVLGVTLAPLARHRHRSVPAAAANHP